jgi:hypothetical protein
MSLLFLDAANRVVRRVGIDAGALAAMEEREAPFEGSLEAHPGFTGKPYPADRFFRAVFSLGPEVVQDLIPQAERLLREPGNLVRAGIWNDAEAGYIRLGFEFEQDMEKRVVTVRGREWAVWHLSRALASEEGSP